MQHRGIGGISENHGSIALKKVKIQVKKEDNTVVDSVQTSKDDGPKSVGFYCVRDLFPLMM